MGALYLIWIFIGPPTFSIADKSSLFGVLSMVISCYFDYYPFHHSLGGDTARLPRKNILQKENKLRRFVRLAWVKFDD